MFGSSIDVSDVGDKDNHYETRALACYALMMKCNLNEQNVVCNITDGYHDLGLDAIYLDESQKTLFLVQSKWRNDGAGSIKQEEMNTFVEGIKRILNFELDGANEKIISKRTEIENALDNIGYKIEAIFVHTGNGVVSDFVMRPMNEMIATTNDDAGDILYFSQITFKDVYEYLTSSGTMDDITIDDVVLNNWGKIDDPFLAYYGVVSAVAVGEWFNSFGNKLFAQNIRFYKGRTDVNDGIRKVLAYEPERFVYYNNGIKLLCKKITRKAKNSTTNATGIFTLQGVSLINGAQTTGSIGTIYAEDPQKLEKAYVIVQMIDMSKMDEGIEKQITKLSNTQNRIENKDFAAQDPNQERLKRDLAFSHYSYLYKTGDEISDSSTQLSFEEAIVALACLNKDVSYANIAKRNVGALSDDITKAPYKALFNYATNAFELLNSVLVVREVEKIIQSRKQALSGKEYGACVHGNRLMEHIVLQEIKKENEFSNSVVNINDIKTKIKTIIDNILPIITLELATTYQESYPANVFKNQTKSKELCDKIMKQIKNI